MRESSEDLLDATSDDREGKVKSAVKCGRCGGATQQNGESRVDSKRLVLRRSCTWQYPTENYDEEDNSRLSGSAGDHKCEYSTDNSGDTATEGSDGCAKR